MCPNIVTHACHGNVTQQVTTDLSHQTAPSEVGRGGGEGGGGGGGGARGVEQCGVSLRRQGGQRGDNLQLKVRSSNSMTSSCCAQIYQRQVVAHRVELMQWPRTGPESCTA